MKNEKISIDLNNIVDLYIRVSTSEQAEEGYSVAEHLSTINEVTPADIKEAAWKSIQNLQTVLDRGDMDEVHRIIHTLIDKIVVLNADVTIYWSFC